MIDTDKYEGHTPADQWTTYKMGADKPHHAVRISGRGLDLELKFGADAQLIADAPLILQALIDEQAEVKRLRELIEKVAVVWKDYNYEDRTEWFYNFCDFSEAMKNE